MTEVYQEGLRIPVVRLIHKGALQNDILDLLLLNARVPNERRGDYFAQFAAAKLGVRRLQETLDRYGSDAILSVFDQIIEKTESRLRAAVLAIPDGVYRFSDVMDDDGLAARNIPIVLTIHKAGDKIIFDFKGSGRQVPGNINMTLNGTVAAVSFALKSLLDPEIPNNEGVLRVVDVRAEKGLIVNAEFPAATAARLGYVAGVRATQTTPARIAMARSSGRASRRTPPICRATRWTHRIRPRGAAGGVSTGGAIAMPRGSVLRRPRARPRRRPGRTNLVTYTVRPQKAMGAGPGGPCGRGGAGPFATG